MQEFIKINKALSAKKMSHIGIGVITILLFSFVLNRISYAQKLSCGQWMGINSHSEYKTDKNIIDSCDDKTFRVINHEYAKDKNFVYYKSMPNAYNMTIVLEGADSKSFKLLRRCTGYALDKNHVFLSGKIVENKDPNIFKKYDSNNPETYCH